MNKYKRRREFAGGLLVFIGLGLAIGSVGGLECGAIGFLQAVVQCALGVYLAHLGAKFGGLYYDA